jgi:hypothetical protein
VIELWGQLFHKQTDIGQSRSSTLNPMQWTLAITIFGLFASICVRTCPVWVIVILACCIGSSFLLIAFAFVYLLFKNPDALRSESFTLSKIAIEKGLIGDSLTGLREVGQPAPVPMLSDGKGDPDEIDEVEE